MEKEQMVKSNRKWHQIRLPILGAFIPGHTGMIKNAHLDKMNDALRQLLRQKRSEIGHSVGWDKQKPE